LVTIVTYFEDTGKGPDRSFTIKHLSFGEKIVKIVQWILKLVVSAKSLQNKKIKNLTQAKHIEESTSLLNGLNKINEIGAYVALSSSDTTDCIQNIYRNHKTFEDDRNCSCVKIHFESVIITILQISRIEETRWNGIQSECGCGGCRLHMDPQRGVQHPSLDLHRRSPSWSNDVCSISCCQQLRPHNPPGQLLCTAGCNLDVLHRHHLPVQTFHEQGI